MIQIALWMNVLLSLFKLLVHRKLALIALGQALNVIVHVIKMKSQYVITRSCLNLIK